MRPNVASEPIPAVPLTAPASLRQPLTNQLIRRGSLHAVHTACVVHQVVKVVEVSVANYTVCKPLALIIVVVCCRSHSTQLYQQSGESEETEDRTQRWKALRLSFGLRCATMPVAAISL
jgi:hypothetical protein